MARIFLDSQDFQRSLLGSSFRTLTGEGESIIRGIFSIKSTSGGLKRIWQKPMDVGKFLGVIV